MPRGNAPCKIDQNQPEIVAALRAAGYFPVDTHNLGGGFPDLLVPSKTDSNRVMLIEVKMPGENLNSKEKIFHAAYPGRIAIVRSGQQAVDVMQNFDSEVME